MAAVQVKLVRLPFFCFWGCLWFITLILALFLNRLLLTL
nr:MAG TPA: hypothetical protein [Bacteriophage sp.]